MSTPLNSVGPVPPSGTSNPISIRRWWTDIIDWIKGLSPANATTYDSGPVNLIVGNGWSAATATSVQRIGKVAYLSGEVWGGTVGTTVAVLDQQFWPKARLGVELRRTGSGTAAGKLSIAVDGVMTIYESNSAAASPGFGLGTISWIVR